MWADYGSFSVEENRYTTLDNSDLQTSKAVKRKAADDGTIAIERRWQGRKRRASTYPLDKRTTLARSLDTLEGNKTRISLQVS